MFNIPGIQQVWAIHLIADLIGVNPDLKKSLEVFRASQRAGSCRVFVFAFNR